MNKNQLLKIINVVLGVVFLLQMLSGVFHGALGHELFEAIHVTGAILLAVCVIAHVSLNWTWVARNLLRKNVAV